MLFLTAMKEYEAFQVELAQLEEHLERKQLLYVRPVPEGQDLNAVIQVCTQLQ